MIITIDGPVATGKSTIAKLVAEKLNFIYFDTGAMYRCFTWYVLHHHIDYNNPKLLLDALSTFTFDISLQDGIKHYTVGGVDVTKEIRSPQVTDHVSQVAALAEVRKKLVQWQRSYASNVDVVFEGRDLGSVVFPQADIKIFLTGSDEVRAKRRYDEFCIKFPDQAAAMTLEKVLVDLRKRDHTDSTREHSPLIVPQGAVVIDTSNLSIDEVVQAILRLVQ